jgi:hypothetical protein
MEIQEESKEYKIQLILRQTDYTEEEALAKLLECNEDAMLVIKKFLGIPDKKQTQVSSVNQEIYKQLRYKLDSSMREYQSKKDSEKTIK